MEGAERGSDPRAAGPVEDLPGRAFDRDVDVARAQELRDPRQSRTEDEGLDRSQAVNGAEEEVQHQSGVAIHRAADVREHHDRTLLLLPRQAGQLHRRAAEPRRLPEDTAHVRAAARRVGDPPAASSPLDAPVDGPDLAVDLGELGLRQLPEVSRLESLDRAEGARSISHLDLVSVVASGGAQQRDRVQSSRGPRAGDRLRLGGSRSHGPAMAPEELEQQREDRQILLPRHQQRASRVEHLLAIGEVDPLERAREGAGLIGREREPRLSQEPPEGDDVVQEVQGS